MKSSPIAAAVFLLTGGLTLAAAGSAENWPQWRGPHLNGTSTTASNLPVTWSETENLIWRAKLPSWAAATPIIWDEVVFITTAEEGFATRNSAPGMLRRAVDSITSALGTYDQMYLMALNRKDGTVLWKQPIGDGNTIKNKQNMASPSPVTDGKHVWVATGLGVLTCFDFSGKQIWRVDIQKQFGEFGIQFGYATSPLLDNGRLYIQNLHGFLTDDPSYLVALDAATGKTIWKVERPTDAPHESPDSYSTPTITEIGGERQLIVSGGDYLTGHNLATGKEMWRAGGLNPNKETNSRTIASPLVEGDMIFAPSRRRPLIAFRKPVKPTSDPVRVWDTEYGPDVPTPTSDGERLYIIDDRGIALCLRTADGATVYDRSRIEPGTYSASPVLADGKIYATSEEGTTVVLAAGGEFKVLGVNKLNSYTLASPAVVGSQIFIRTSEYLYCIGSRGAQSD